MTPPINLPEPTIVSESGLEATAAVMGLLAAQRRRALLRYLERVDGAATLSEVAEAIATETRRSDPAVISDHADAASRAVRDTRISLHHVHVPKLAEADAIDYDPETETLTLLERGRTLLERQAAVCGPIRE
ncbi:DUF7344 domain-containing protein [Natronolimnohabitans innermongolicus]|uniref:DUF7344 domain-containing protein n=1 Tax=Natronolimnohabitans innermongolicus JCM 12255 TaxID=1227499 RepID=L9X8D2_9EURY|nr:hypothetical protein [Natronolimnohabitans innermongolicus]ELY57696.1 hypothetical protein C493_07389 [Natronolimnohabitans innermongolicus JCM 12255]